MDSIQTTYWDKALQEDGSAVLQTPVVKESPVAKMMMDPLSREYWQSTLGGVKKLQGGESESGNTEPMPPSTTGDEGEEKTLDERLAEVSSTAYKRRTGSITSDLDPEPVFIEPDEGTPAAEALAANAAVKVSMMTKGLRKLNAQKLKRSAMKKLNIVKQLRKTQGGQQFSKNFKGKVIDGVHELYTLTAGMMLGMRCSVGRNHPGFQLQLQLEDFSHVEKITFPALGSSTTPPHSLVHTFKFKSYSLKVFRRIRDFFGIDNAEYMNSVCGNYNYLEFISNSKSGQFFFYSHDGKYMIKTQTKEENKFMKQILPHYYKFVTENPHTLLCRIVGMHRVKMYHLRRQVRFVIMTSVFDTPEKIHTVYDLKGSLIGRQASPQERENGGVLKDLDLVNDGKKLHLGSKKAAFMAQLKRDAMFLAQLNIMDYSLLVGIHDRDQRTVAGPGLDAEDSYIFGPSGQHSNTPFRRRKALQVYALSHGQGAQGVQGSVPTSARVHDGSPWSSPLSSPAGSPVLGTGGGGGLGGGGVRKKSKDSPTGDSSSADYHPASPPTSPVIESSSRKRGSRILDSKAPEGKAPDQAHDQSVSGDVADAPSNVHRTPFQMEPRMMLAVRTKSGHVEFEGPAQALARMQADWVDAGVGVCEIVIDLTEEGESDEGEGEGEGEGEEEGSDGGLETIEEEPELEEHFDDGDSDPGAQPGAQSFTPHHAETTAHHMLGYRPVRGPGSGDGSVGGSRHSPPRPVISSPASSDNTPQRVEHQDAGKGWKGLEGSHLSRMVRKVDDSEEFGLWTEKVTFGPGASQKRPWTRRRDGGINSRLPATDNRGHEIYFCGVIDILQQYNLRKRTETFFKSFTNDSKLISSVDSFTYASRFVHFIGENMD